MKKPATKASRLIKNDVGELTFGVFLKVARTGSAITQSEMGKKLGVTTSVVCDIEKGRQLISPSLAIKIARKAKLSEKLAVQLCLQDQLRKAGVQMKVKVS
ncbi:MAG: helix-turn-helix transcriptional regulator [Bdellovibrionales bacterium]